MSSVQTPTADTGPAAAPARHTSHIAARARVALMRYPMLWILGLVVLGATLAYDGFLTFANLENLLSQNAPIGIVAIGMTFVIISGGFDLSVGALFAGGAVVYGSLDGRVPAALALVAAVAVGIAAGGVNGALITRIKVNPFIATLGTASVFAGAVALYAAPDGEFIASASFSALGSDEIAGLPIAVWVLALVAVVAGLVLARTVYGRSVYTVGGNLEAARLAGMRVDVLRASVYVLVGACATFAGAMLASRVGVGQADIGATIALDAIAIVIIGGTSLFGGEGAIWRTVVGLLILATINNLFDSLTVDSDVQAVIKGGILIAAVGLDVFIRARE